MIQEIILVEKTPCSNLSNRLIVILITEDLLWYNLSVIHSETQKLQNFFAKGKPFHYKKGETIQRSGDFPQGVLFLKSGYARLESISKEGKELTMVVYRPGEFFPVVWAFFGERASIYDLEALTNCEIVRVPRGEFLDFIGENPDVLLDITKHIITRFQLALKRMTYLTFGNSASKLASILLICGRDYGVTKDGQTKLQIPLTHKDIANLVGVTRETVSLELKKFDRKGFIGYNKKFLIIKNKKGLEQEAILS